MKRKIEICRKCSKLEKCPSLDNKIGYICGALFSLSSFYGTFMSQIPWGVEDWNKMDVPSKCELYAEYFVEECNK